jgi:hypothetical protein
VSPVGSEIMCNSGSKHPHFREHRPLACSSRQLAANMLPRSGDVPLPNVFGQRSNTTGWQVVLPGILQSPSHCGTVKSPIKMQNQS